MKNNFYDAPNSDVVPESVFIIRKKWLKAVTGLAAIFVLLPLYQVYYTATVFDISYHEIYYFYIPELLSIPICIISLIGALRLINWSITILFLIAIAGPISKFIMTGLVGLWPITAFFLIFSGILSKRIRRKQSQSELEMSTRKL